MLKAHRFLVHVTSFSSIPYYSNSGIDLKYVIWNRHFRSIILDIHVSGVEHPPHLYLNVIILLQNIIHQSVEIKTSLITVTLLLSIYLGITRLP